MAISCVRSNGKLVTHNSTREQWYTYCFEGDDDIDDGLWHDAAYFTNDDNFWHDDAYFFEDDGLWHDNIYF